jgi:hypothetical protein
MTPTTSRYAGFLLVAIVLVAGFFLDRIIEAAAVAAVALAVSIWIGRLLAPDEQIGEAGSSDKA